MTEKDSRQISAASLAYLGDAVMEVLVRRHLVTEATDSREHPSQRALPFVTASAQSAAVERILPFLSEPEVDEYRRGRNCVHANVPKSATAAEYRRATGLECLFGYLELTGQTARAAELFRIGYAIPETAISDESKEEEK